jgi:hypothetical protein
MPPEPDWSFTHQIKTLEAVADVSKADWALLEEKLQGASKIDEVLRNPRR